MSVLALSSPGGPGDLGPEAHRRRVLYRPVSLIAVGTPAGDEQYGDRGAEVVGPAGALCDRGAGPGAQGALLRPGLLPRWRPSCSGRGSGRWRAGSRRSPRSGDFAEYEILDQSVLVVRTEDMGVRAFDNVCRHRGVRFAQGRGSQAGRLRLPLPRLVLRHRRPEHAGHPVGGLLRAQPRAGRAEPDAGALRDLGRLRLDQPRRRRTAAARVHGALRHRARRLEDGVARGPSGGTPPASRSTGSSGWRPSSSSTTCCSHIRSYGSPGATRGATPATSIPRTFLDSELQYLRTMSDGMAGMVHARDLRDRRGAWRTWSCRPTTSWRARPGTGRSTTRWSQAHRARGCDMPDLNELAEQRHRRHRCGTASRTSSCSRCTAAPPPTASARSAPRRP